MSVDSSVRSPLVAAADILTLFVDDLMT